MSASAPEKLSAAEIAPGTSLGVAVLALNNAHANELSWLAPERLQHLVINAFAARAFGALMDSGLTPHSPAAARAPNRSPGHRARRAVSWRRPGRAAGGRSAPAP